MKAIISGIHQFVPQAHIYTCYVDVAYYDGSDIQDSTTVNVSLTGITTGEGLTAAVTAAIIAYSTMFGYGVTASDIIGGYPLLPNALNYSFANPSRSLNSAFQISASRVAMVSYAVDVLCALTLTTGEQGTVYLEYADDSGFTTNVVEVSRFVNGNTGTLTLGLALTQNATGGLSGVIPAGKYVRLRTQNNTGTPTFTFRRAQEVLA